MWTFFIDGGPGMIVTTWRSTSRDARGAFASTSRSSAPWRRPMSSPDPRRSSARASAPRWRWWERPFAVGFAGAAVMVAVLTAYAVATAPVDATLDRLRATPEEPSGARKAPQ